MKIINSTLEIGVPVPFKILHISDTHLAYDDMRDGERKVKLAKERAPYFNDGEAVLGCVSKMSKELNAPIVHTGDLIDFVSEANLERVKSFVDNNDLFMAAGNHEFSLFVGEAKEDAAYREQSLSKVQSVFKNDIRMSSRIVGGVNFVAIDNGYYLIEKEQLDFIKKEVQKGLPVILLVHTPFYERSLYEEQMKKENSAYLVAVPEELMSEYSAHRKGQQMADEANLQAVEYIAGESAIKGVIAGHLHDSYDGFTECGKPQLVTSCTDIRIIEIK